MRRINLTKGMSKKFVSIPNEVLLQTGGDCFNFLNRLWDRWIFIEDTRKYECVFYVPISYFGVIRSNVGVSIKFKKLRFWQRRWPFSKTKYVVK